ncbi:MAG TPA: glycogen debranching N-terminal domain-containing protein, partial [Anaeromyxobacteraceae bacterium]|nr:glycogen debranching N-terminal domain-containing protein [Anaeromyxobacteraceae bacterium]
MDELREVTAAEPGELLGYDDPSAQPEATGVEKLVLKRGNLFLVANRVGDVWPPGVRDLGLFLTDTRHLSAWRLRVRGGPPVCLSSQVSADYVAQIDFTVTSLHEGDLLGREPVNYVHLRRDQIIDDVFVDRLVFTNFLDRDIDYWIEVDWAVDFADVFELRGAHRARRGAYHAPELHDGHVALHYEGRDGRLYATEIRVETAAAVDGTPRPARVARLDGRGARVELHLGRAQQVEVSFVVAPGIARGDVENPRHLDEERPVPHRCDAAFERRAAETHEAYRSWSQATTRIRASNDLFEQALSHATADLKALTV